MVTIIFYFSIHVRSVFVKNKAGRFHRAVSGSEHFRVTLSFILFNTV